MKDIVLCRNAPAAHLLVRGPDAAVFLQGQFTNDLRRPQNRPVTYGLWLNQKGRVLADSFILARGPEEFDIVSLTSPAAVIRQRLEAYIIADDVTVVDETDGTAGWIVAGEGARDSLMALGFGASEIGAFSVHEEAIAFRARAAGGENWFFFASKSTAGAWTAKVDAWLAANNARSATRLELACERIASGLPEIPAELGPGDLPNEGGLEHEAISFTKGCYLGQEVMARLHNLGQVRRRLFVVRSVAGVPLAAELFLGDRRVGAMRAVIPDGNRAVGLAMLHTTHVHPGAMLAASVGGPPSVEVLRLAAGRAW